MERKPQTKARSKWNQIPVNSQIYEILVLQGSLQIRSYQRDVHDGHLSVLVAKEPLGSGGKLQYHMSISHRTNGNPPKSGRYPTWDEIADARYKLLPQDLTFVMFLPPPSEYVAVHDTTFHLHEYEKEG